jgi:predicted PurR-regulated permease PerM
MAEQHMSFPAPRFIFIAAAFVVILWGITQAQSVVVLVLVSVFLAVLGTVPVRWMEGKHVPSIVAVVMVMAAMVCLILSIGVVIGASLNNFSNALPFYQSRVHEMLFTLKALLASKGIEVTDKVLIGYFDPAMVMNVTASLFSTLGSTLSNALLVLFTVMFILLEAASFPAKLRLARETPRASFPQVAKFINEIKRYVVIKTVINLVAGVLVTLWLWILGVDFPVLWGFLTFLLQFIPNVGSIVAAAPAVLLALIQRGGGYAALAAAGYLVIGLILGNIVEPRIMGRKFGLSTLVVFLSLIFWGTLLGMFGALLCVPLTLTLKLACEESEETRWIAVILGPVDQPERAIGKRKQV